MQLWRGITPRPNPPRGGPGRVSPPLSLTRDPATHANKAPVPRSIPTASRSHPPITGDRSHRTRTHTSARPPTHAGPASRPPTHPEPRHVHTRPCRPRSPPHRPLPQTARSDRCTLSAHHLATAARHARPAQRRPTQSRNSHHYAQDAPRGRPLTTQSPTPTLRSHFPCRPRKTSSEHLPEERDRGRRCPLRTPGTQRRSVPSKASVSHSAHVTSPAGPPIAPTQHHALRPRSITRSPTTRRPRAPVHVGLDLELAHQGLTRGAGTVTRFVRDPAHVDVCTPQLGSRSPLSQLGFRSCSSRGRTNTASDTPPGGRGPSSTGPARLTSPDDELSSVRKAT